MLIIAVKEDSATIVTFVRHIPVLRCNMPLFPNN